LLRNPGCGRIDFVADVSNGIQILGYWHRFHKGNARNRLVQSIDHIGADQFFDIHDIDLLISDAAR
jgi:hypothetical protein